MNRQRRSNFRTSFERATLAADAERAELIASIAKKLSAALLPVDVATVLVSDALPALEAHAGFVVELDPSESGLALIAPTDLPPEVGHAIRAFTRAAAGALAARAADPKPVVVESTPEADLVLPGSTLAMSTLRAEVLVTVPLVSAGRLVGALTVGYHAAVTPESHGLLTEIAAMGAQALDRARKYERERATAELLQRALLVAPVRPIRGLDIGLVYRPARSDLVGGDWYDVIVLRDSRVLFVMGDVAGHGVSAATTMAMLRQGARAIAANTPSTASLLDQLSDVVHTTDNKITTMVVAIIDRIDMTVSWSSAGHPPPLLVAGDGSAYWLDGPSRPPLGVRSPAPTELGLEQMRPGATLLLYTDGLVERKGESVDVGLGRLAALSGELATRPVIDLEATLLPLLEGGTDDDVAALAVRITG